MIYLNPKRKLIYLTNHGKVEPISKACCLISVGKSRNFSAHIKSLATLEVSLFSGVHVDGRCTKIEFIIIIITAFDYNTDNNTNNKLKHKLQYALKIFEI